MYSPRRRGAVTSRESRERERAIRGTRARGWAYAVEPPGQREIRAWLAANPLLREEDESGPGGGGNKGPVRKAAFRSQVRWGWPVSAFMAWVWALMDRDVDFDRLSDRHRRRSL